MVKSEMQEPIFDNPRKPSIGPSVRGVDEKKISRAKSLSLLSEGEEKKFLLDFSGSTLYIFNRHF
jgi:hypothetical protein